MNFKIKLQRVCWCIQCETMLPRKCAKCVKHPDNKPRVVELYGVPAVLDTNECGCVKIRCQRDGCTKTMWRHPKADGTLGHKNHFHDPECVRIATAAARVSKRITVICSCGCGRTVTRPASNLRAKHSYFSQKCHFTHRVQMKSDARRKDENLDIQSKFCPSKTCKVVTDHIKLPTGLFGCVRCNARSKEAPMISVSQTAGMPKDLAGGGKR